MTLRTLNYGNHGIFLIMGHAGFCPSTVGFGAIEKPEDLHYMQEGEDLGVCIKRVLIFAAWGSRRVIPNTSY